MSNDGIVLTGDVGDRIELGEQGIHVVGSTLDLSAWSTTTVDGGTAAPVRSPGTMC